MSARTYIILICDTCDQELPTRTYRIDAAYREATERGWKCGGERTGDKCETCAGKEGKK